VVFLRQKQNTSSSDYRNVLPGCAVSRAARNRPRLSWLILPVLSGSCVARLPARSSASNSLLVYSGKTETRCWAANRMKSCNDILSIFAALPVETFFSLYRRRTVCSLRIVRLMTLIVFILFEADALLRNAGHCQLHLYSMRCGHIRWPTPRRRTPDRREASERHWCRGAAIRFPWRRRDAMHRPTGL
jgi:hypothetical protein